jgi:hypothetical protein
VAEARGTRTRWTVRLNRVAAKSRRGLSRGADDRPARAAPVMHDVTNGPRRWTTDVVSVNDQGIVESDNASSVGPELRASHWPGDPCQSRHFGQLNRAFQPCTSWALWRCADRRVVRFGRVQRAGHRFACRHGGAHRSGWLADTLMPEAFEHGRPLNAFATAGGSSSRLS